LRGAATPRESGRPRLHHAGKAARDDTARDDTDCDDTDCDDTDRDKFVSAGCARLLSYTRLNSTAAF
jgi:hypothetical protein